MELAPAVTISDYTTGRVLLVPVCVTYEITLPAAYDAVLAHIRDADLVETIIMWTHHSLDTSPLFEGSFQLEIDRSILFTIGGGDATPEALRFVSDALIEHLSNIDIPETAA